MIKRTKYLEALTALTTQSPVVALVGPRQCGKTTLARELSRRRPCVFFDLENPSDLSRLDNPLIALGEARGLVVVDEVQRRPDLLEVLRFLVDREANEATFLILGSASPSLVEGVSETLAGRVAFLDMSGFDVAEVDGIRDLWIRGGFPRSFLASSDAASLRWRNDFVRTLLERDVPMLGIRIPQAALRRFWTMIAHMHGQRWNAAELARSLGSTEATARRYLDLMSGAYMVRQLQPWFSNVAKRQIKSPKVYVRDSGILHALLSVQGYDEIVSHHKVGASWEGFVVEQIISLAGSRDVYHWGTHAGAELDLLLFGRGRPLGFEIKYSDAPRTTRSMRIAIDDLGLSHLWVVHPGDATYPLDSRITALSIRDLAGTLREIAPPAA